MRILFIGDVVGSPGREMVEEYLPRLKRKYSPGLTIVNGENAASGKGITEKIYRQFLQAGANIITLGNHAWDKREIFDFIDDAKILFVQLIFLKVHPARELRILRTISLR